MSEKPINLRQARKARMRANARKEADANSLAHGRTKAERQATRTEQDRAARAHEGHRREHSPHDAD